MRALILAHRYFAAAAGALVLMWSLSGLVMAFVPYPRLGEAERRAHLAPLDWGACCARSFLGSVATGSGGDLRVEMLGRRPVLRGPGTQVLDLRTGELVHNATLEEAGEAAASFDDRSTSDEARNEPHLVASVSDDVWTLSGVPRWERPLYQFALDDRVGHEVYVSRVSGRVVQVTTRRQRFWNWLGAIPHWLYLVPLRRRVGLWSTVVVWAALTGSLLGVTGLVVGLSAWRRHSRRVGPPLRGWYAWHHRTGLIFGLFACTWAVSGLLSMNPGGLLEGRDARAEQARLHAPAVSIDRVLFALRALVASPGASGLVAVEVSPLMGTLYLLLERADGTRVRLDEAARPAPLSSDALDRIASAACAPYGVATVTVMKAEDAYYYGRRPPDVARLPVVRVVARDPDRTRYYLDAESGEIVAKFDRAARGYRWLFAAPHRLDVWPGAHSSRGRMGLLLAALIGVICVSLTGLRLGLRRLVRWLATTLLRRRERE